MFFDYWITFVCENYLFLAVCASLNLFYLKFESYGDIINSLFTIFSCLSVLVFTCFYPIFYNVTKNFRLIVRGDTKFLAKYGSILSQLNFLRKGRICLVYESVQNLRKLWLVALVILAPRNPVYSIF